MSGVVAQLKIDTVPERALGGVRQNEERAQLGAIYQKTAVARQRLEREIGAQFEPWGDPEPVFRHSVQRVVRNDPAGKRGLRRTNHRIVVVQRDAELTGCIDLARVHLNFVCLRMSGSRN